MCHTCSMTFPAPRRRCTDNDVDANWWLEPDLDPRDFGAESGHSRSLDTEYGQALLGVRRNQERAKLLCYDCPFIEECRAGAWDEPAHVWAGLDANERFSARSTGQVRIGSTYQHQSARKSRGVREKVVSLFKQGLSVEDIAATLGCNTDSVWYHIKGAVAQLRRSREEQLWQETAPPALPGKVSRALFRSGALTTPTEEPPLGPDSSSGSDTRMPTAA